MHIYKYFVQFFLHLCSAKIEFKTVVRAKLLKLGLQDHKSITVAV